MSLSKLYLSFFYEKQFVFGLLLVITFNVLQAQSYSKNCFESKDYYNPSIQEELEIFTKKYIEKSDPKYLIGIETKVYQEDDVLTYWLGKEIKIIEVPGHDNGQLALMPSCHSWCLVGDLIQGIGTVVISPKPEGSMSAYFKSLQKVIDLNPKVIYPSHGIAMGGVFRLEQTLIHRQKREDKILELLKKEYSVEQMLSEIYPGLEEKLVPFARVNIIGHIEKLEEEQVF